VTVILIGRRVVAFLQAGLAKQIVSLPIRVVAEFDQPWCSYPLVIYLPEQTTWAVTGMSRMVRC